MGIEAFDAGGPGRTAAWLARQVEVGLGAVGLTLSQYRLLVLLEAATPAASALAERLAVSRPSVTAVVDGLVARGLVRRGQDKADRRRVMHVLTPRGRALLGAADKAVDGRLTAILGHLDGPAERVAAIDDLGRWREALQRHRAAKLAALREAGAERALDAGVLLP